MKTTSYEVGCLTVIRVIAVFLIGLGLLAKQSPAVPYEEPLRLGMEVAETSLGIRVESIETNRPIETKIQPKDVLRSFRVIDRHSGGTSIRRVEDVTRLKELLDAGDEIELTFWRPTDGGNRSNSFVERTVVLTSADLLPHTEVQTKTYTVMAPGYVGETESATETNSVASVSVYYATDRLLQKGQYSGQRDRSINPVKYGICTVTLPPDHRIGKLEEPKWWKLEFRENPHKHVVLGSVMQTGKQAILSSLSAGYKEFERDRNRLLIFVHGYNVSFEDAARRSAQLHHDLNFQGQTAFFSWPSNAKTSGYVSDAGDIQWSTPHIRDFIKLACSRSDIDDVIVLAHSMGNRGVTKALVQLANSPNSNRIREIILAAPDIDADLFERDIAPQLNAAYGRTTVYASAKDRALQASKTISQTFRAGEIRQGLPTISTLERLDVIDATAVDSGLMGHSYYGDGKSVLADIFHLVRNGLDPGTRFDLIEKRGPNGPFWLFR